MLGSRPGMSGRAEPTSVKLAGESPGTPPFAATLGGRGCELIKAALQRPQALFWPTDEVRSLPLGELEMRPEMFCRGPCQTFPVRSATEVGLPAIRKGWSLNPTSFKVVRKYIEPNPSNKSLVRFGVNQTGYSDLQVQGAAQPLTRELSAGCSFVPGRVRHYNNKVFPCKSNGDTEKEVYNASGGVLNLKATGEERGLLRIAQLKHAITNPVPLQGLGVKQSNFKSVVRLTDIAYGQETGRQVKRPSSRATRASQLVAKPTKTDWLRWPLRKMAGLRSLRRE